MEKHLIDKYNKVNVRILQLMRMRQYITTNTALTIYKQMIIPLFDYADFMVESASKGRISKLEKLQEKALKCVENECQKKVDVGLLYGKHGIQPLCLRHFFFFFMFLLLNSITIIDLPLSQPFM